ncbi:MAG: hypothetical protein KJZ68_14460 [Phycisphaerales bacterium]|nr:hypothetical protein [Phycisphaerales bacterium]
MVDDGHMGLELIPNDIRDKYTIEERDHACAILKEDFPSEFDDLLECLRRFTLKKSQILEPGGRKSRIASTIDAFLHERGWREKSFDTKYVVDDREIPSPTHSIDNFKNRVGVEVEWNNKTEFYDRDLNNFRLLRQLRVLSVGVIITRLSELQQAVFDPLGKGSSYGASTTHWDKLIPKVDGGGAGGCPLLLVGMGLACYDPNA